MIWEKWVVANWIVRWLDLGIKLRRVSRWLFSCVLLPGQKILQMKMQMAWRTFVQLFALCVSDSAVRRSVLEILVRHKLLCAASRCFMLIRPHLFSLVLWVSAHFHFYVCLSFTSSWTVFIAAVSSWLIYVREFLSCMINGSGQLAFAIGREYLWLPVQCLWVNSELLTSG